MEIEATAGTVLPSFVRPLGCRPMEIEATAGSFYLLLGLGSWFGAAVVERLVDSALG